MVTTHVLRQDLQDCQDWSGARTPCVRRLREACSPGSIDAATVALGLYESTSALARPSPSRFIRTVVGVRPMPNCGKALDGSPRTRRVRLELAEFALILCILCIL